MPSVTAFNPAHLPLVTDHNAIKTPKLRIAIIAHSLYPIAEPFAGGLEMITQLICDELVSRGHDVLLYAHADSQTKAKLIPLLTRDDFEAQTDSDEHSRIGMSRDEMYQYVLYQDAMRDLIVRDNAGQIDVIHNHSLHHVPMLMGQAFGARFFTAFHTPLFPHLRLALTTLQSGTASQFTSVSHHQKQLFSKFVPSAVVYNGIDVTSFEPNTQPVADEVYFWFGRICPEKGTHLAMQYCRDAGKRLVIAGPKSNTEYFDKEVAPLLAKDAQNDGTPALFDYVGHLTKEVINHQLRQSTAMLFTSTWDEPYGLTLAESLACGTPVIGFDAGAAVEIITSDSGIIVPKMDASAFIQAFDRIGSISRRACRMRAETFCSVDAMVDGYVQLYEQTLSKLRAEPINQAALNNAAATPAQTHPVSSSTVGYTNAQVSQTPAHSAIT